jgi:hypothetical protein
MKSSEGNALQSVPVLPLTSPIDLNMISIDGSIIIFNIGCDALNLIMFFESILILLKVDNIGL